MGHPVLQPITSETPCCFWDALFFHSNYIRDTMSFNLFQAGHPVLQAVSSETPCLSTNFKQNTLSCNQFQERLSCNPFLHETPCLASSFKRDTLSFNQCLPRHPVLQPISRETPCLATNFRRDTLLFLAAALNRRTPTIHQSIVVDVNWNRRTSKCRLSLN
jgi:hypothetical protein